MAYHALDRKAESDAALEELITKYEQTMAYNIAYVLAYRGEADRAFEWLEKAVKYRDPSLGSIAVYPMLKSLRSDPRWLPVALTGQGARATRGDQVRRERAQLVEVAHRSFDRCP
jgi:tetratricopeptide (TPR) repeat protein